MLEDVAEGEVVVVEADIVARDGYCVPVLSPKTPVYIGKAIGAVWPENVSSILY